MALHPQTRALLDAMAAMPPLDFARLTAAQLRQLFDTPGRFAAGDAEVDTADDALAADGCALPVRLYRPRAIAGALPVTLYFHGGGFVTGTLDTHDNLCRCLAHRAGSLVVSVAYRLAPEHPFPAAPDDAWFALQQVAAQAARLGGDARRLAVAGDSAGGTLAAVAAQRAAAAGLVLRHQLLLYPLTDCGGEGPGYEAMGRDYFLTTELMHWYLRQYLPRATDAADPRASPLRQPRLAGVAPATIVTAQYDPLCAEGEAYAERLRAAGVAAALKRWPGQIHGFASMLGVLDDAQAALDYCAQRLREAFTEAAVSQREHAA